MTLTGPAIRAAYARGDINIEPFNEEQVSVNSYDMTLFPQLLTYDKFEHDTRASAESYFNPAGHQIPCRPLDPKIANPYSLHDIPEEGFVIVPGELYLGRTNEVAGSHVFLSEADGKSSVGRLGIGVHVTAGRGDVGFNGTWTLEIWCVRPVILYPNMPIAQVYFERTEGEVTQYSGKYKNQFDITPSRLYRHWQGNHFQFKG